MSITGETGYITKSPKSSAAAEPGGFMQGLMSSLDIGYGRHNLSSAQAVPQVSEDNNFSLMQKLAPDQAQSFKPPPMNAGALTRDPSQAATDLGSAKTAVATIEQDTLKAEGNFESAWDKAQSEAQAAVKEAAVNCNLDPNAALRTLAPRADATQNAMIDMGAAASGKGSFVTFTGSATNISDMLGDGKGLSRAEAEMVLAEAVRILTAPPTPNASFATIMPGGAPGSAPFAKSDFQWENLGVEGLQEFLAADIENQPEMREIRLTQDAIAMVHENHRECDDRKNIMEGNKAVDAIRRNDQGAIAAMKNQGPGQMAKILEPDENIGKEEISAATVLFNAASLSDISGAKASQGSAIGLCDEIQTVMQAALQRDATDPVREMQKNAAMQIAKPLSAAGAPG
jgi:hypothetical protein